MPSSWEGSCLTQDRQSARFADPPEPEAPEGFLLSEAPSCPKPWLIQNDPARCRNGRPGSRGSRGNARAQARGACRRERGESRTPMAERASRSPQARRASAAITQFQNSVCRDDCRGQSLPLVMRGLDPRIHPSRGWIAGSSPATTRLLNPWLLRPSRKIPCSASPDAPCSGTRRPVRLRAARRCRRQLRTAPRPSVLPP